MSKKKNKGRRFAIGGKVKCTLWLVASKLLINEEGTPVVTINGSFRTKEGFKVSEDFSYNLRVDHPEDPDKIVIEDLWQEIRSYP